MGRQMRVNMLSVKRGIVRFGVLVLVAPIICGSTTAAHAAKPPTAPDTIIDSGPAAVTNSTTATFTFHSTVSSPTFTCKLDSGTATACTSPKSYSGLTQ